MVNGKKALKNNFSLSLSGSKFNQTFSYVHHYYLLLGKQIMVTTRMSDVIETQRSIFYRNRTESELILMNREREREGGGGERGIV